MATIDPNALKALQAKHAEALKSGAMKRTDILGSVAGWLNKGGESGNHIVGADGTTSESHTETKIAGRQSLLRVM